MTSKTTKKPSSPGKVPSPVAASLAEFQAAVLYTLVSLHGVPRLVAQELVDADQAFLASGFERGDLPVLEAADEIAVKPGLDARWVKVDEGALVLGFDGELDRFLTLALETGLFGSTKQEVVEAMVRRGGEAVLPVLSACSASRNGGVQRRR